MVSQTRPGRIGIIRRPARHDRCLCRAAMWTGPACRRPERGQQQATHLSDPDRTVPARLAPTLSRPGGRADRVRASPAVAASRLDCHPTIPYNARMIDIAGLPPRETLLAIVGPTGVGKTAFAVRLAQSCHWKWSRPTRGRSTATWTSAPPSRQPPSAPPSATIWWTWSTPTKPSRLPTIRLPPTLPSAISSRGASSPVLVGGTGFMSGH